MNEIEKAINFIKKLHGVHLWKPTKTKHHEYLNLAEKALTQQLTNGWIPVSERLPKETSCVRVLATLKNECVCEAFYILSEFKYSVGSKMVKFDEYNPVIAWQQLPEPYKEASKDAE